MFDADKVLSLITAVQAKKQQGFSDMDILLRTRLCLRLGLEMREVEDLFGDAWAAWMNHVDYETPDKSVDGWFWAQVVLMGVWRHAPGRYGHNESYVVGRIADIFTQLEWARKMWAAEFVGLQPIVQTIELPHGIVWTQAVGLPEDEQLFDADPETAVLHHAIRIHPSRIATYPYSYAGGGAAYLCRMAVKSRLPSNLKPLVSKTRRLARQPKHALLDRMPGYDGEQYKVRTPNGIRYRLPRELRQMSKAEIWLKYHLPPEDRRKLGQHIDPLDFYAAVTGRYDDPMAVVDLFRPPLFRGAAGGNIKLQPPAPQIGGKKTAVVQDAPNAVQLNLFDYQKEA